MNEEPLSEIPTSLFIPSEHCLISLCVQNSTNDWYLQVAHGVCGHFPGFNLHNYFITVQNGFVCI